MELNYWGSTIAKRASYDEDDGEWTLVVERDGNEMTLRPKQLVMATGMSGRPHMPQFPGVERLQGRPAPLLGPSRGPTPTGASGRS